MQQPFRGRNSRLLIAFIILFMITGWVSISTVTSKIYLPIIQRPITNLDHDWITAFHTMRETLKREYAFGEWKQVDWDGLYTKYYPTVVSAARVEDEEAYYVALRKYVHAIPDGHLEIDGDAHNGAKDAAIGGGFGFAVIELDDGSVIAHIVEEGGSAEGAGMSWGAEILTWEEQPIATAIDNVSTIWADTPRPTSATHSIHQHHLLTRAPIGTERTVTFRNPNATESQTVTLQAYDDDYSSLNEAVDWSIESRPGSSFDYSILANGIGYIKIAELDNGHTQRRMREAMQEMVEQNVPGLVLDLRNNDGGDDEIVPETMNYFTSEKLHYEHITYYDEDTESFEFDETLTVDPNPLQFTKPVAVLINHKTISSGEGYALIAQKLPQARVVGIYATEGSFGMTGGELNLPNGIEVYYPLGHSLDDANVIQVDSNHLLAGGIEPDIRISLTLTTARNIFIDSTDVILAAAIEWLQE